MVPEGTNRPASLPNSSAASASKCATLGSSPRTSSPTSASAIATRICAVGLVTVSLRMSTQRSLGAGSCALLTLTRLTAYSTASSSPSGGSVPAA